MSAIIEQRGRPSAVVPEASDDCAPGAGGGERGGASPGGNPSRCHHHPGGSLPPDRHIRPSALSHAHMGELELHLPVCSARHVRWRLAEGLEEVWGVGVFFSRFFLWLICDRRRKRIKIPPEVEAFDDDDELNINPPTPCQ